MTHGEQRVIDYLPRPFAPCRLGIVSKQIVITGVGSVSSVGIGTDSHYQALLEGKSGIETLPEWAEEYPCKVRCLRARRSYVRLCSSTLPSHGLSSTSLINSLYVHGAEILENVFHWIAVLYSLRRGILASPEETPAVLLTLVCA